MNSLMNNDKEDILFHTKNNLVIIIMHIYIIIINVLFLLFKK